MIHAKYPKRTVEDLDEQDTGSSCGHEQPNLKRRKADSRHLLEIGEVSPSACYTVYDNADYAKGTRQILGEGCEIVKMELTMRNRCSFA